MKKVLFLALAVFFCLACEDEKEGCDPTTLSCGDGICLFDRVEGEYDCTEACDPASAAPCEGELVCEPITDQGNRTACVTKVYVQGHLFDQTTGTAIKDGSVTAKKDPNGTVSEAVTSAADGSWSIEIRVSRNSHVDPTTGDIYTFEATATGYQPLSTAPVSLDQFEPTEYDNPYSAWYYASEETELALTPVEGPTDSDILLND